MDTDFSRSDMVWVLTCAMLVMLMQAGFCCLESGLVRSKNSINVAMKNLCDFCVSSAVFWVFGYALMFGASSAGWVGTSGFFFGQDVSPRQTTFFLFQMMFCGTVTTILSGSVAERIRFSSYLGVSVVVSGLIYPLMGHWAWAATDTGPGWFKARGFIDFAGSTVVHATAGWVSLAAVLIVGPRLGRFAKKQQINELSRLLNNPIPYDVSFSDQTHPPTDRAESSP